MDSFRNMIAARSLTFWVTMITLFVLVISVVSFFLTHALYVIGSNEKNVSVSTSPETKIRSFFGISALSRKSDQLIVKTTGQILKETRLSLSDKPLLLPKKLTVSLESQHTVSKLGTSSLGCDFGTGTVTYNYDCSDPRVISRLRSGERLQNDPVYELDPVIFGIENYLDGLLILSTDVDVPQEESKPERLTYFHDEKIEQVPFTVDGVNEGDALKLITNTSGGTSFAVLNETSGQVYLFSSLSSLPKKLSLDRAISASEGRFCTLTDRLFCYSGLVSLGADAEEGALALEKQTTGELRIWDESGNTSTVHTTPKNLGVDMICAVGDTAFVSSSEQLYRLQINKNDVIPKRIASEVVTFDCGTQLFYTTSKGIYSYKNVSDTSSLIFLSNRHLVSNLSVYGKQIHFNTFVSSDPSSTLQSYRVQDTKLSDGSSRYEDILPYVSSDSIPIVGMDYSDTFLFFQVVADPISNRQTGTFTADPEQFETNKQRVLDQLDRDKIDLTGKQLRFVF